MLRTPLRRALAGAARPPIHRPLAPSLQSPIVRLQTRMQSHALSNPQALSNPTLANIEKRWEGMAPQEQAELWVALRDRMKVDWHQLTPMEKKACEIHPLSLPSCPPVLLLTCFLAYYIAFGPHGARSEPDPNEGWKVFGATAGMIVLCLGVYAGIRYFARDPPKTMSREWQEATNEYLKVRPTVVVLTARYSNNRTGAKSRADYRYLIGRVFWPWLHSKSSSRN
jgi:cytochrome c oxidase subunit 4